MYKGISDAAPWTLKGVKRGHASKAVAHKAGDELVKLQQNCYNGFVPDMKLLLDYADYYADLMDRNGMDIINFDGFESTLYQNHGYYAVRVFCRRLFETYHKLTGGNIPASPARASLPALGIHGRLRRRRRQQHVQRGQRTAGASRARTSATLSAAATFPPTFGIQGWHSDWSLYDAENLMSKAVGWDATFALAASQDAIDQAARRRTSSRPSAPGRKPARKQLFTKEQKERMKDPVGQVPPGEDRRGIVHALSAKGNQASGSAGKTGMDARQGRGRGKMNGRLCRNEDRRRIRVCYTSAGLSRGPCRGSRIKLRSTLVARRPTSRASARQARRIVAAADRLSRTAAERDPRFPLQAEVRRVAPALEGRDRRRRRFDRRHRAEHRADARRVHRTRKPEYFHRGYEWWLMKEAKKRNPQIIFDILQWGAPGWIGDGKFYSQDNADFIAAFIKGAKKYHDLDISYCGSLEREAVRHRVDQTVAARRWTAAGCKQVKIVAADEINRWTIADKWPNDAELRDAVQVIGTHYPHFKSTPAARGASASRSGPTRRGRGPAVGPRPRAQCFGLAQAYNRNYVIGKMTKSIVWSPITCVLRHPAAARFRD